MMVKLTETQEKAASKILDWFFDLPRKEFYLAGYAGTGKSTIVKEIIDRIRDKIESSMPKWEKEEDRPETVFNVVYCAYTGKAASVLANKGNVPATTIHSLIYRPEKVTEEIDGRTRTFLKFTIKEEQFKKPEDLIFSADLLVLDECSMVSEKVANDLRSFNKKILVLGDPGQLPPVDGLGAFTRTPDFFLKEVHRQAIDSPILRLATLARQGKAIEFGDHGAAKVFPKTYLYDICVKKGLQTICGYNTTRSKIINYIRRHRGFTGPFPYEGESLVCLRNNIKAMLFNGMLVECTRTFEEPFDKRFALDDLYMQAFGEKHLETNLGDYIVDTRYFIATHLNNKHLRAVSDDQQSRSVQAFDYAYAITCHKAQGSQWDHVLVYDESKTSGFENISKEWLYTAITRAAEGVIILQ